MQFVLYGVILLLIAIAVIYSQGNFLNSNMGEAKLTREEELHNKVKIEMDRKLKNVQTYFFTDSRFDFEKFCDYILCIRNDSTFSDYLDNLAEMELLLNCSPALREKFMNLLMNAGAIIAIVGTPHEFEKLQESIKNKEFKGTYPDLTYIFFTTVFYLKFKLGERPE